MLYYCIIGYIVRIFAKGGLSMPKQEETPVKQKGLLKRFISYYRPHRKLFAMDMAASLMISAIGMVYPVITNLMLNDLIPNFKYKLIVVAGLSVLAL